LKSPQTTKLGCIKDLMLKSPQADLVFQIIHISYVDAGYRVIEYWVVLQVRLWVGLNSGSERV
jgi:hypothetical protein